MNLETLIVPLVILCGVLFYAPNLIWVERRLLALWQDRYGPNRLGPFGLLQTLADAIKMFFKEDWVPSFADKPVFIIAPAIIMTTSLSAFALIPFSPGFVVFDSHLGLPIFLAISSMGSYSIFLAGLSSNNNYALLGSMRGAAQMLSYEVFMAISLLGVVMLTGSFRFLDIIEAQKSIWNVFPQFFGFLVFFVAALAETHRLPFDIPEAESEIVAGFHSEYSGLKFGMFFVGEYIGISLMSSFMTVLFFGGYLGPFFPPIIWFLLKTTILVAIFILIRAALPRLRYDQLMEFGWKILLPISLLNIIFTASYLVLFKGV